MTYTVVEWDVKPLILSPIHLSAYTTTTLTELADCDVMMREKTILFVVLAVYAGLRGSSVNLKPAC